MGKAHVINIDMDRPCNICGRTGDTAQTGICLKCAADRIAKGLTLRIGNKIFQSILTRTANLLNTYQVQLNDAYLKTDDLTISISIKIRPKGKYMAVQTMLSFVAEKVQDGGVDLVDEAQGGLFDEHR